MEPGQVSLGYDADGVLYGFHLAIGMWLREHRSWDSEILVPTSTWEFYEEWGMTVDEFLFEYAEAVRADVIFSIGETDTEGVALARRLAGLGHRIHLVTDRSLPGVENESRIQTYRWLSEVGLPAHSVTFSADKTCVDVDLFLDDRPSNYREIEELGESVPILWNQPWNESMRHARRVKSWDEWNDLVGIVSTAVEETNAHDMDPFDRIEVVQDAVELWFRLSR